VPNKKKEISLLPEEKRGWQGILEKATNWLVNTGRWIIVFTELIVILAFFSRFFLDQRLADLYDQTAQKVAIINASKDFENELLSLQKRLDEIATLEKNRQNQKETLENIVAVLPPQIRVKSISLSTDKKEKSVEMTVVSPHEEAFVALFKNLILTPYFSRVEINNISVEKLTGETELSISAFISS